MVALIACLAVAAVLPAREILLWPDGAPGSEERKGEKETTPNPWSIGNIQNPSITVYLPPKEKAIGTGVVIAPGGGHAELVIGEEGRKPAEFLNSLGIAAFVLKYRLANEPGSKTTVDIHTRADAYRAVRLVRSRASEWGVEPKRIGMMGFSAGGEVLSMAAFAPGKGNPVAKDPIERESERPDFGIWIYPGPYGVPDNIETGSPEGFVLVANDDFLAETAFGLVQKMRKAKVPVEMHVLASGGHGFNMGDRSELESVKSWPMRLKDWLIDRGWAKR